MSSLSRSVDLRESNTSEESLGPKKTHVAMLLKIGISSSFPVTECLYRRAPQSSLALFRTHSLTCIVSPAAMRRCCPIGERVGRPLVVNLRVSPLLVSLVVATEAVLSRPLMPPTLRRLVVLGGDSGLFE
jgi:hypothetical protein